MKKGFTIEMYIPKFDEYMFDDVQYELVGLAKNFMEEYVPMDTGDLRRSAIKLEDGVLYDTDYASHVYYMPSEGIEWTTPNTGSFWDKRMMADRKDQLKNELSNYINRRKDWV